MVKLDGSSSERATKVESDPLERAWSPVLAGGNGERVRPFIERWLGCPRPKQYCAFVGNRSMFQHTIDRADLLTAPERRMTVIARSHRAEARAQFRHRVRGR